MYIDDPELKMGRGYVLVHKAEVRIYWDFLGLRVVVIAFKLLTRTRNNTEYTSTGIPRETLVAHVAVFIGELICVVLQASLEVVDVASDGKELEDLDALALRVAIPLAVLSNPPFALPPDAASSCQFRGPRENWRARNHQIKCRVPIVKRFLFALSFEERLTWKMVCSVPMH